MIATEEYLFHISPIETSESIQQQGFIPNENNQVFFIRGSVYNKTRGNIGRWIGYKLHSLGRVKNAYTIYKIDVTKLPDKMEFYPDPENKPMFVYTTQTVPYSCVVDKIEIRIRDERKYRSRSNT